MKTLYSLSSILVLIIILVSCKKEEKPITFPLALYADKLTVVSATRMFTKDGEVKDTKKIASFTAKETYFNAEADQSGKGMLALTFQSNEKATFGSSTLKFDVLQDKDQFLFISEQSYSSTPLNQHDFRSYILKHIHPISAHFTVPTIIKEVHIGYGKISNLRLPMVAYRTRSGTSGSFTQTAGLVNNEFDETAISYLKENDTLAVKLYQVVCKARI